MGIQVQRKCWMCHISVCLMMVCGVSFYAELAQAEFTCPQLLEYAEKGLSLRDQGASLSMVQRELLDAGIVKTLNAEELILIRQVIAKTFTAEIFIYDLVSQCQAEAKGAKH